MEGFGVHTSMWTMNWDREGAERAVAGAKNMALISLKFQCCARMR